MRYARKDYRKVARQMLRQHPILLLLTLLCQLPSMLLNIFCLPQPDRTVKDVLSYLFRPQGIRFPILVHHHPLRAGGSRHRSDAVQRLPRRRQGQKPRRKGFHARTALCTARHWTASAAGGIRVASHHRRSPAHRTAGKHHSWRAYWLRQITGVIVLIVEVVWTVLIAVGIHAVRYRFVLDPDSGVWNTFKHAREDMNDWRFDLLMTILPIGLWYLLCLAGQTVLVLYAGMVGRVVAELLPVPILAYAIMTLLLALDDIDTPEEAETAAPKEA